MQSLPAFGLVTVLASLPLATSCVDGGDAGTQNEGEVITTLTLTFTPAGGGDPVVAVFDDPDGDGGEPPTVDAIELPAGDYSLELRFENRLEDPPENITAEIADEAEEHQVFLTGSAVRGPASDQADAPLDHGYADADLEGLPLGLDHTISASPGAGNLVVTLRHLPPVNDEPVKAAGLADAVRSGGFGAIPGETDAQVTFAVTVVASE